MSKSLLLIHCSQMSQPLDLAHSQLTLLIVLGNLLYTNILCVDLENARNNYTRIV